MLKTTRRKNFNRSLAIRRWSKGKTFQNSVDSSSDEEQLEKDSIYDNTGWLKSFESDTYNQ